MKETYLTIFQIVTGTASLISLILAMLPLVGYELPRVSIPLTSYSALGDVVIQYVPINLSYVFLVLFVLFMILTLVLMLRKF